YPFELKNEKVDDDGDITYELRYNGDGYIWNRSIYQEIDIDYFGNDYSSSDDRYVSGVWISRPKNFNIAEREQYDGSVGGAPAAGGADDFSVVSIPDLAHYFSAQNLSEEENEVRFTFDTDPRDAVRYYVELLQNKYHVVLAEVYEDDGAGEWVLHHENDPDAPFTIWVDRAGDGTWEVICRLHIFVIQTDWEVWEWPQAAAPEPEPEPEPAPGPQPSSSDPSVIPNFLDHDASGKYEMTDSSKAGMGSYAALDLNADYVAQNYVDSLVNMGYSVVYTEEDVHSGRLGGIFKQWDLRHDGVNASALRNESSGQIRIKLNTYEIWDKCTVSVEFADGITMEGFDGGSGGGSSGSGGGSSSNHLDSKRPCNICNRTGDCQTCGGDGYLWSSANDKENRNCYSCRNGKCRTCNGTGWID
ncbi:MAG: hypothetical protein IKM54_04290, partial [Butyricicoccus sp.]|nr:hypothetical protein [Butyricicoccus sp.]